MKTNKIIITGIIILFSIILMYIASAQETYNLVCLQNKQSIPKPWGGNYTCALSSGSGFCTVCANTTFWYAPYSMCAGSGGCIYLNSTSNPPTPEPNLTMTVGFPFPNGGVYTKTSVTWNVTVNKATNLYLINNILGTQTTLCTNCKFYRGYAYFKDGFNNITVRASKGLEVLSKVMTFIIDSTKPSIITTNPRSSSYTKGYFNLSYTEANLKDVILSYGNESITKTVKLLGCNSGKSQWCAKQLNLSDFDGSSLTYWFNVTDIANNNVKSYPTKVNVDLTAPIINKLNYTVKGRYAFINMTVTEKNLNKIVYTDNSGRENYFCYYLYKNTCSKNIYLNPGAHNISIYVSDKAGNLASKSITLTI